MCSLCEVSCNPFFSIIFCIDAKLSHQNNRKSGVVVSMEFSSCWNLLLQYGQWCQGLTPPLDFAAWSQDSAELCTNTQHPCLPAVGFKGSLHAHSAGKPATHPPSSLAAVLSCSGGSQLPAPFCRAALPSQLYLNHLGELHVTGMSQIACLHEELCHQHLFLLLQLSFFQGLGKNFVS